MTEKPIQVFFSYSHRDEEFKDELVKHLSILQYRGVISGWNDRMIVPGSEWDREIDAALSSAEIILLMVSPDFLASDYCWGVEVHKAMQRHETGEACVIPVVLRVVDWHEAPFAKFQALPKNAKPIARWSDRDEAFYDVVGGIKVAIATLRRAQKKQREEEQQAAEKSRLEAEAQKRQEEKRQAVERARLEAEERKQQEAKRQAELRRQAAEQARLEAEERKRRAEEWQAKFQQQIEERKRIRTEEQKQQEERRRREEEQFRQGVEALRCKAEKLRKQMTELFVRNRKATLRFSSLVIILFAGGAGSIWLSSYKPFTQEFEFCKKQALACGAIWLGSGKADDFRKRASFRKEQGEFKGALADYDQAIEPNSIDSSAFYDRGVIRANLGDKQGAIADYSKAIELDPKNSTAFYSRGEVYAALGNPKEAINDYTRAIDLLRGENIAYNLLERENIAYPPSSTGMFNPIVLNNLTLSWIYNDRGIARSKLPFAEWGERKDEILDYTEAIKLNPDYADPYYNRGLIYQGRISGIYEELGDKQRAIADFQKAADLYQQQGDLVRHQIALNQLKKLSADNREL